MEGLKEATVQELAELSGRTPQSLYPHLDALVAAQFLVIREPSESGRRSRVYACGPMSSRTPWNPTTGEGNEGAATLAALMLRDACARLKRFGSASEGVPTGSGAERTHANIAHLTWLDEERRRELNTHFDAIAAIVQAGRSSRAGRRTNVLLLHFPDVTLREAKSRRKR